MADASARVDYWRYALTLENRHLLIEEIYENNRPPAVRRGAKETEWSVFRSNIEAQVAKFQKLENDESLSNKDRIKARRHRASR